jgi:hypothetical protein
VTNPKTPTKEVQQVRNLLEKAQILPKACCQHEARTLRANRSLWPGSYLVKHNSTKQSFSFLNKMKMYSKRSKPEERLHVRIVIHINGNFFEHTLCCPDHRISALATRRFNKDVLALNSLKLCRRPYRHPRLLHLHALSGVWQLNS